MTAIEGEILESLQSLEAMVAAMPSANPKPDLRPLFAKLDTLTAGLPKSADPDLLHYLHKKSYRKALLFLQGREAENQAGNCGHI